MRPDTRDTLVRLLLPWLGVVAILLAARIRHFSPADLGVRPPNLTSALIWTACFAGLVILEEILSPMVGVPAPERWGTVYGLPTKLLRVVAMVVSAPVAEELLFRGLIYHVVANTWLRDTGAIVVSAAAFAALHVQYGAAALLFVVIDGLFYGTVRYSTDSILLTIALHAAGNAYAAYQRF